MAAPLRNLRELTAQGGAAILAAQLSKLLLQFAAVSGISHFLLPSDFGLIALVTPLLVFITLFSDLGISQAVVQKQEISQDQLSALFWLTLAVGTGLAALMAISAPLLSWFYGEPRVTAITAVLSLQLPLGAASVPQMTLLTRNLRFRSIAAVEVSSLAIGTAVGILIAWRAHSYWALIAAQLVGAACAVVGAWIASTWRPNFKIRAPEMGDMLRFGGNVTGFNFVNFFARNLDNVLIGKVWGSTELGYYSQAYKLLLLPLNQISIPLSRLAVPLLSRLVNEPERYRRAFLGILEVVMLATAPLVIYMLVMADHVIPLVLGQQWKNIVPVFIWLGSGAFFAPFGQSTGWLFISQGRTGEMFRWGLVSSLLFVLSFVIGLKGGGLGVAKAYILMGYLVQGPMIFWVATRSGCVHLRDFVRVIAVFFAAILGTSAMLLGLKVVFTPHSPFDLAAELPLTYLLFCGVLATFPQGRRVVLESLRMLKLVLPGSKETASAL